MFDWSGLETTYPRSYPFMLAYSNIICKAESIICHQNGKYQIKSLIKLVNWITELFDNIARYESIIIDVTTLTAAQFQSLEYFSKIYQKGCSYLIQACDNINSDNSDNNNDNNISIPSSNCNFNNQNITSMQQQQRIETMEIDQEIYDNPDVSNKKLRREHKLLIIVNQMQIKKIVL